MRSGKKKIFLGLLVLVVVVGTYSVVVLRQTPLVHPTQSMVSLPVPTQASLLAWPTTGQSAVGIVGSNTVVTHTTEVPTPTASVAKLITALVVLKAKPLTVGEQGPLITLSAADVAIYSHYVSEQGSVVPVVAGETMSEYQMLEAMLLPSANDMADSLAIWAYGSLPAYAQAANSFVAQAGLIQTHVGLDASGFDPSTVSTAHDLVLLGELAMQNPVIAGIVKLPSATGIPIVNTVKNINSLLGTDGIVGVKTGNTTQAGGVFVSASQTVVNNTPVTIVTALAGTPTLAGALKDSLPFILSTHSNFHTTVIAKAGSIVGSYTLPWGGTVPVVAAQDLSVTTWNDSPVSASLLLKSIADTTSPTASVGSVTVEQSPSIRQGVAVQLSQPIPQPSIWWRLRHPHI